MEDFNFYVVCGDMIVFAPSPRQAGEVAIMLTAIGIELAVADRPADVLPPMFMG